MHPTAENNRWETAQRELGMQFLPSITPADWARSQQSFVAGQCAFLQESFLRETCSRIGLDPDACATLLQQREIFAKHPYLERLLWHHHFMLFGDPDAPAGRHVTCELPRKKHFDLFPILKLYLVLSGLAYMREWYRRRKIPGDIERDSLVGFVPGLHKYRKKYGVWGCSGLGDTESMIPNGFRVGRLYYGHSQFPENFHVFRHTPTRRVVMLAGDGMRFRADGQQENANGTFDPASVWTASFEETAEAVAGAPISADGRAHRRRLSLSKPEWTRVLLKGNPILNLHIPTSELAGPLTVEACAQSFARAMEFFPKYIPEWPFHAIWSSSWLFDNQLGENLPAKSNIRRFQEEFYLYPISGANERQTLDRVFDDEFKNADDAPRDTSLRRMSLDHMRQGGVWRMGGAFRFPEETIWGQRPYRCGRGWMPD